MELAVILLTLLSIVIIVGVIFYFKKLNKNLVEENKNLIKKNKELLKDISKKDEYVKQVLKNKEEEKQLHISLRKAYERVLSELYFQNKEAFKSMPHTYMLDNKIIIRQPVPLPHLDYTNGDSILSAELKYETKVVDLISIDLVRDVSKSPYFFISQGKDVRAMISIGADYALLPEPPEEIALRLTREIFSFLSENKYKLRY